MICLADKSALPEDMDLLFGLLKEQFEAWRQRDRQLILVIDGLNKVCNQRYTDKQTHTHIHTHTHTQTCTITYTHQMQKPLLKLIEACMNY